MDYRRISQYIGITAMILMAFGLSGWYLFLRTQTSTSAELDAARGLSSEAPSFFGARGSTLNNLLTTLGFGDTTEREPARPPRLWKAHATPVAGMGFISTTSPTLRFVDRATGHVFDVDLVSGGIVRRTNTLMPQVYEASVAAEDAIVARTIEEGTISTFLGAIATTTEEEEYAQLVGRQVTGILEIETLDHTTRAMALERFGGGTTIRSIDIIENGQEDVFMSPVGNWDISWLRDGTLILVDKPASAVAGNAYRLDDGELVPLVRGVDGLTMLARASSTAILYGSDSGSTLMLRMAGRPDTNHIDLPLKTVATKCVWDPVSELDAYCAVPDITPPDYLDRSLRGEFHSSDSWWKVSGTTGMAESLFIPSENAMPDVLSPMVDAGGAYIAFLDGKDRSLWVLRIAAE